MLRAVAVILLVAVPAGLHDVNAQDSAILRPVVEMRPQIGVSASVTVRGEPDAASLYFVVEAPSPITREAAERAAASAANVADTLRKLGSSIEVAVTDYGAGPSSPASGMPVAPFTGRSVVRAELTDLTLLSPAIEAAFGRGATGLAALRFSMTDMDSLRNVAVSQAVDGLRSDAGVAARRLGGRLGRMTHMSTHPGYDPAQQPVQLMWGAQYASEQAWRTPPEIVLTVNANASFELIAEDQ